MREEKPQTDLDKLNAYIALVGPLSSVELAMLRAIGKDPVPGYKAPDVGSHTALSMTAAGGTSHTMATGGTSHPVTATGYVTMRGREEKKAVTWPSACPLVREEC